jgi:Response regulators consisting of a CheY-like receiver domain and a winged-helix DNA-binding domain
MTAGASVGTEIFESIKVNQARDRVVITRDQLAVLEAFLDVMKPGAVREMDCTESHVFGDFQIDVHLRRVLRDGVPVHLTPREYDLLLALARRDGAPASIDELVNEVWQRPLEPGSRTLSQHVHALRRKLERDPSNPGYLTTVSKFGYRLEGGSRSVRTRGAFGSER